MRSSLTRFLCRTIPLWLCLLAARPAQPYSVLSHEALVDALWATAIRPVLLRKFPDSTREQLKEAHGYAYGGAVIQDMGFYPHGNGYFSDLTHYVRPADFIQALLGDARTLNELAFALGALSHYAADCLGHRYGTNIAEPQLYPKLQKKYGATVTYEDDPSKHLKTEYGFDVSEVAKGNFAPQAYHDFIGFYVATPLLDRAFRETYGLGLTDLMDDVDGAVGSYRRTISKLIPLATRVAWAEHQDEIRKAHPGVTRKQFLFVMRRSSYERYWGKQYDRPTLIDRILAFLLKLLPPIGPLKTLHFKTLTPPVEGQFMHSFA
ncbi:MAG: zinc dependent phospholipase C family protein, partial [Acidobacteriota bacterium]|nr:zinc dependent phospholipase C family protein [Acidobacteriota bacterium]